MGEKRIGVAISDASRTLARPVGTLRIGGLNAAALPAVVKEIERLAAEDDEVDTLVVGLPKRLDGSIGTAAEAVEAEVATLADVLAVPVVTHDERLTTVTAHQQLQAAGVGGRRRRQIVDQQAAVVILQSWLDANRPETTP